jgi:hypothetical protein
MKKNVFIFSLLIISLLSACGLPVRHTQVRGSGKLVSESRSVHNFDHVVLEGIGNLVIMQGDSESLLIEVEDNILPHIETSVYERTLHISFEHFVNIQPRESITFSLTVKDLRGLKISGLGDITIYSLETDHLDVEVSGGGRINVKNLSANSLDVDLSGAGDFELSGKVGQQNVELSGAGNYQAGDLQSQSTWIEISGLGNATVWVIENLELSLSGVGSLEYYGHPTITKEVSGLGNVESLGEHE